MTPLIFPDCSHLHGIYTGNVPHLLNKRAMLREGNWQCTVLAQFDAMYLPEAYGWHEFNQSDFVNIEGEDYGYWPE